MNNTPELDLDAIERRADEAWKVSHRGTHLDLVGDARALVAEVRNRDGALAALDAVLALVNDESRHMIRWIDDSRLVDVSDILAALARGGVA